MNLLPILSFLNKKTREELQDLKAIDILNSIEHDTENFTHEEGANIITLVLSRFKARKKEERKKLLIERDEINSALKSLNNV